MESLSDINKLLNIKNVHSFDEMRFIFAVLNNSRGMFKYDYEIYYHIQTFFYSKDIKIYCNYICTHI